MKRIGNVSVMLMLAAMMAGFSGCGEDEEDNHLQLDPDHLS